MKIIQILLLIVTPLFLQACGDGESNSDNNAKNVGRQPAFNNQSCLKPGEQYEGPYGGGEGTKESPYLICTVDHFNGINGGHYFKLTSDIDFINEAPFKMVRPVLDAKLNGDGYTVKNATVIHGNQMVYSGLWGALDKNPFGDRDVLENVIFDNIQIISQDITYGDVSGAIASQNRAGIIKNVHVRNSRVVVMGDESKPSESFAAGGLVGDNWSLIEDSSFSGEVGGNFNLGGIAGKNSGVIKNVDVNVVLNGRNWGVGRYVGVQFRGGQVINPTGDRINELPSVGIDSSESSYQDIVNKFF